MAYSYQSRRSMKRLARKSRRNFIITLVLIGFLGYATLVWILPTFINTVGFIKNTVKPSQTKQHSIDVTLAPPILSIPFEATNTAEINIKGFGTPNSKVKLFVDDDIKQEVKVLEDGSFIVEKVPLSLGTNNINAKTLDENDKESLPSKTIKLIYTFDKPNLTISGPEDGKQIQGGDRKIKVSGETDPGVKIFINDTQVIVSNDGNFTTEQPLNDGENKINIKAIDNASNATEEQISVTYTP